MTLLFTSDLHASLRAWDYGKDVEDGGRGLTKIATLVKTERDAHPCSLLLDGGDTLQGAPVGILSASPSGEFVAVEEAMRALHYDAAALGNHDFDFGVRTLDAYRAAVPFPVLAANVHHGDGSAAFPASTIQVVCGTKVGILGLTTPTTPAWERKENLGDLTFADLVTTARAEVPRLRSQGAQVVVLLAHMGPELAPSGDRSDPAVWTTDPGTWTAREGVEGENAALAIAREIPGIDVILSGHTHQAITRLDVHGVVITQPRSNGAYLSEVTLHLAPDGQVTKKDAKLFASRDVPEDPEMLALTKPAHDRARDALGASIGSTTAPLPAGYPARLGDGDLPRWVNEVALGAARDAGVRADLSCTTVFGDRGLPQGSISLRDLFAIYPYENTLEAVEIDGKTLRAFLEQDATYFRTQSSQTTQTAPPTQVRDWKARPDGPDFNWDVCAGIQVTLDLTKPEGARVTSLSRAGRPISDSDSLTALFTNYRAGGGGGFPMLARRKHVWSSGPVRDLLAAAIRRGPIDPSKLGPCELTILPSPLAQIPLESRPRRCPKP